jgi:subtilase family serine protease
MVAGLLAVAVPAAHADEVTFTRACDAVLLPLHANCHAIQVHHSGIVPNLPSGFGPADLQSAYAAPGGFAGLSETVAIVDAYDDPNAESDLAVYRSTYGLPACTTANGCFRKINQRGGTTYPAADVGWGREISLDLDMVSAMCKYCNIVLVEADDNSYVNLGTAVNRAAGSAIAVSNSYGGPEFFGETGYDPYYNHPGVAVTVSSGDSGYGVEYPAASPYVTSVGGTHLTAGGGTRGWTETAWSGAGSGCSAYEPKPGWQTDSGCSRRTVADVSAVADPSTPVAVYDTYGTSGWVTFGGTSAAAPIIAAEYALAGSSGGQIYYGSSPYTHGSLYDITTGSNGSCGGSYLCTARSGYDGPTGLGTPNGTGAFVGGGGYPHSSVITATPAVAALSTAPVTSSAVYLLTVNATLRNTATSPLPGRSVRFTAGTTAICTATTNAAGTASCSLNVTPQELAIVEALGYTASFDGDVTYWGSSAHAGLVTLNGAPLL